MCAGAQVHNRAQRRDIPCLELDSGCHVVLALETPFQERDMKKILLGIVLLAMATPALAAEFYIVQDSSTKKCTIVDKRPTVTTTTVVGGDRIYTTREEATTAMKTVKICHD
jgi:hypothetical protein